MHEDGGAKWFWQKWHQRFWPETPEGLLQLRVELREVWGLEAGGSGSGDRERGEEVVLNRWLAWRPNPQEQLAYAEAKTRSHDEHIDQLIAGYEQSHRDATDTALRLFRERIARETRPEMIAMLQRQISRLESSSEEENKEIAKAVREEALRRFENARKALIQWDLQRGYLPFWCSVQQRGFVPDPKNMRAVLIVAVFENHGYMKYCVNPDCLSPYFIAKRKDQSVCDAGACKAERQRLHALKWWRENRAPKGSIQPKMNPVTRKARKDNGTRKAQ